MRAPIRRPVRLNIASQQNSADRRINVWRQFALAKAGASRFPGGRGAEAGPPTMNSGMPPLPM